MQSFRTELTPIAPYDFALTLAYLQTSSSVILERVEEGGVYRRALTVCGQEVLLSLRLIGTVDAPRLLLEVQGSMVDGRVAEEAVRRVRRLFSLDADPAPFLQVAAQDPVLANLARRFHGLRPVLIADPYESLLWAILGQQVNVTFARKLKVALVALCGQQWPIGDRVYPMLPRPETVAALDPQALRACQFSRQKAAYVIGLSQAVAAGMLDFEALRPLPPEAAITVLTRFHGVGRWTAEIVLMRGLGDFSVIPAADIGLRAILGRAYGLGRTATEAEVRKMAEPWGVWQGWAAFYWWLAINWKQTSEAPYAESEADGVGSASA